MRSRLAIVLTGIALGLAMRLVLGTPEQGERMPRPKVRSVQPQTEAEESQQGKER